MNRIISLICLTTTTACFSMQHDKQQCTAQIAAFLQYHKIPSVQPKFRTLTFLNNKLHVLIENDDKARIIEILPLYDAHCDVDTHGTSVIIASQHRLDKFAKLKTAMEHSSQPLPIKLQKLFYQRRNTAFEIFEILTAHRDKGFHRAICEINPYLVQRYTNLGARIDWEDEGKNSFDHARIAHEQAFAKANNTDKQQKIKRIQEVLCNRRDQLLYWKILYGRYSVVCQMIDLGASPNYYIQEEKMTALELAKELFTKEQDARLKGSRESIYMFLQGVADGQAHQLAQAQPANPDDYDLSNATGRQKYLDALKRSLCAEEHV